MTFTTKLAYKYSVIFMFSLITNVFAMEKPPEKTVGAVRTTNISGNILTFSMPENFSKDMPAEPLLENVLLSQELNDTLLIQRWWDIKKPGFWGGNIGTVMMTINVIPLPENRQHQIHDRAFDIQDRVDFMQAIITTLKQRYPESNSPYHYPALAYMFGNSIEGEFRESLFNQQKWTSYSVGGPASLLIVTHAIPITERVYLEVAFNYSPNDGVLPRDFRDAAYATTTLVEQSLHIQYTKNNPLKQVVERKWLNSSTDEALKAQADMLIPKLFGNEALKMEKGKDL